MTVPSGTRRYAKGHDYPHPSSPVASTIMRANPSRDTGPEVRLRSALHRAGARFRVHQSIRVDEGRPVIVDIAFPRRRVAVFLDGCFWHACPEHGTIPKANREYWEPKLRGNRQRDLETVNRLERAGWCAVRVWEHEDLDAACARILRTIR